MAKVDDSDEKLHSELLQATTNQDYCQVKTVTLKRQSNSRVPNNSRLNPILLEAFKQTRQLKIFKSPIRVRK